MQIGRRPSASTSCELQIGDVITSIDNVNLAKSTAIRMLKLLRRVEFGLANALEAGRVDNRMKMDGARFSPDSGIPVLDEGSAK